VSSCPHRRGTSGPRTCSGTRFEARFRVCFPSWCRGVAILGVLIVLFVQFLSAQQDERAVRAAFLFNLTKYVSWPGAHQHLVIGVVGNANIASALGQVLDGKVSDGRPISVVIHSPDSEMNECDMLYLAGVSPAVTRSILNRTAGGAVLTVGDNDQFVRAGGMVALVRSGDQIEIEVNLAALRDRRLVMSSRLLKLAVLVPSGGGLH
jgi:hypothetical protein